ncbi:hypothetical protein phytr_720 [Candidatus Phycorickettsia trachydisci]|uniref:Uncharacterized protein n=1 Tax=Candidatus Phycorickettsia trachydisci TaxID=2115978 RepID=A0A2P1P709_9RICK|nr:ankyrin repeat domain-containing protein [Candidatus Phycorickettsia trachydisci]AVP87035.1 hypothetical protein phytr_720 [Candidatus Phycorickettsia trachydisci]
MDTVRTLLNNIIQNIECYERVTLDPLRADVAIVGSEQTKKALREARDSYRKELSENYSRRLIDAIKLAESQGNDTNPIYTREIKKYKGASILHLIAWGLFSNHIYEILSHIRPQDIKRGLMGSELMEAIEEKNTILRDWLLENDADVMYRKSSGSSALHIACLIKDYKTAERLIQRVAREKDTSAVKEFVNAVKESGCTPLYEALVLDSPNSEIPLDNHHMLKFLSLFIENGVDLDKKNSGKRTGEYTMFNTIITSHLLQNLDLASAAVKMLNSGQNIQINLKNPTISSFFTDKINIQKIILLEEYDLSQKFTALNKIKEELIDFDHQSNNLKEDKYKITSGFIDAQLNTLSKFFPTETFNAASKVTSGIENLDLASSETKPELLGHTHDKEIAEV